MFTVITQDYQNSTPETRITNMSHAHSLGINGGFYKVQVIGEFGEIIAEYK